MSRKRKVEVFTGGCPLCDEAVKLVKGLSCPDCNVIIYDLQEEGMNKAKKYGISSVPTVVVDGEILECCRRGRITEADLKAAGIGIPL